MTIELLKTEIDADPLARGYSGMTDQQVADSLNVVNRERNKTSLTNAEILEVIESSALVGLTGEKARRVWGVLGMDSVDPFGVASEIFIDAFTGGSTTITALAALRIETISRATEIEVGFIKPGHVQQARAM